MSKRNYRVVKNLPVADFWYQGNHSHPVRRKVLVTASTSTLITGYELRCGKTVYPLASAPVKTYRRDSIARVGQLDKRRKLVKTTPKTEHSTTTLVRKGLECLVIEGI